MSGVYPDILLALETAGPRKGTVVRVSYAEIDEDGYVLRSSHAPGLRGEGSRLYHEVLRRGEPDLCLAYVSGSVSRWFPLLHLTRKQVEKYLGRDVVYVAPAHFPPPYSDDERDLARETAAEKAAEREERDIEEARKYGS